MIDVKNFSGYQRIYSRNLLRDRTGEILIDKGKKKKKTVLIDEQIAAVKKIYNDRQNGIDYSDVAELCRSANLGEIREKEYSLTPSKYIEFVDHDLEIDYPAEMARKQKEMRELLALEKKISKYVHRRFQRYRLWH